MKTAVFLPTWVGDACMATPAIRAIRAGMPEITELCLVGRYAPLSVLQGNPWSDSTILYKPRSRSSKVLCRRAAVAELRRKRIDTIILLPNSISSALMALMAGAKRRIGYARDGRRWLLTDRIGLSADGQDLRRVSTIEYYLQIARYLGCEFRDRRMQLWTTSEDRASAVKAFEQFQFEWNHPTLLMNTASAANDSRMWPSSHASHTAKVLAEQHGFQVVIHCGPGDRLRANEIADNANHPRVQSMGQLTDLPLGLSKAIIEQANVVVSTDSGPRHIAAAFNKEVISLFGPTDPFLYRTFNQPERVLRTHLACSPCGTNICPLKHSQCMHGLSPAKVIDAVLNTATVAIARQDQESSDRLPGRAA